MYNINMNDFNRVVTGLEDFGGEKEERLSPEIEETIEEVSRILNDQEHSVRVVKEGEEKRMESDTEVATGLNKEAGGRRELREEIRKIAKEFADKYHKGPTAGQLLAAVERARR